MILFSSLSYILAGNNSQQGQQGQQDSQQASQQPGAQAQGQS